jgi:hypothetical protein
MQFSRFVLCRAERTIESGHDPVPPFVLGHVQALIGVAQDTGAA